MFEQSAIDRFWPKVKKTESCWLWQAQINNKGYGCFRLSQPRRMIYAHRFSYMLVHGEIPKETPHLLHSCDTPNCVNPDHLRPGTVKDNSIDMASRRRGNTVKLTLEQVAIIRETVRGHQSYGQTKKLAKQFGVHRSAIRRVAKKETFTGV